MPIEQFSLFLTTTTTTGPAWAITARARLVEVLKLLEAPEPDRARIVRNLGAVVWGLIDHSD